MSPRGARYSPGFRALSPIVASIVLTVLSIASIAIIASQLLPLLSSQSYSPPKIVYARIVEIDPSIYRVVYHISATPGNTPYRLELCLAIPTGDYSIYMDESACIEIDVGEAKLYKGSFTYISPFTAPPSHPSTWLLALIDSRTGAVSDIYKPTYQKP